MLISLPHRGLIFRVFVWQSFPLVFVYTIPMKALLVISLCLVVFKTSSSCAMPCRTVLLLHHLEDDFASTQRIDASCWCWQSFPLVFTHRLAMKVPVVISLCLVVFKTAKQLRIGMLESVAVATSAASFLTLNTCK